MATVNDIYRFLDGIAPFALQESYDNAGFLVGRGGRSVDKILVSLDITLEVVAEAAEAGAALIVSHHPVLFHPAKAITDGEPTGKILLSLIEHGIAAICAHTNLDVVEGGVNTALAERLGLQDIGQLAPLGEDVQGRPYGIGRVGFFSGAATDTASFARYVKESLGANGVRYVDAGRPVRHVAVGGGACADFITQAIAIGCDTFVTSDVKYNGFLDARALEINLIDAGHYPTEQVICPKLCSWLREEFPMIEVCQTQVHAEAFSYL
ncbi:MAG: Nif3-like dinuclear metal center hexameric protein [Oscillospiraceae bacterium]|nr:Nif3-like dinuclear metal center hexameric protein [Oscillospiraceae bacterium]